MSSSYHTLGTHHAIAPSLASWIAEDLSKIHVTVGRDKRGHLSEPLLAYYTVLTGCLLVPILLGSVIAKSFAEDLKDRACLPSGEFALPGTISIWSTDFILSITVGYGHFSFGQAKAIDICWDLVVGRVGQLFLTWIAFRVFTRAIVYAMEQDGVTCDTYAAVAFQPGSAHFTWTVFSDFLRGRSPRTMYGGATYVAMILVGLYIGLFPTLASAITSYGPISSGQINVKGTTTPFADLATCSYMIRDGSRIGLVDGYLLTSNGDPDRGQGNRLIGTGAQNITNYFSSQYISYCADRRYCPKEGVKSLADLLSRASTSSCPGPEADSTIYINSTRYDLNGRSLDIVSLGQNCSEGSPSPRDTVWTYKLGGSSEIISGYELQDNKDPEAPAGTCNPSKTYQWGFSFLLLFITSVLNAFIFLMLHGLNSWTYQYSRLCRTARQQPGMWRAIIDLSEVAGLREDQDMLMWPNSKLEKEMSGQKMTFRRGFMQAKDEDLDPKPTFQHDEIELQPLHLSFPEPLTIE